MSKIACKVKWVKEKYDVEIMLDEPVEVFKTQLFALTGVPPERQKITAGAKKIEDGTDLSKLGLKPNQLLMLIGTADVLAEPAEKAVFVEDLAPEEMHGLLAAGVPMGLENLGNTCYMNSTLQILNNAPELVENVTGINAAFSQYDLQQNLAIGARDLFKTMKSAHEPVQPFGFLTRLRQLFPQFDQRGEGDAPMQQDAEECLTQIMQVLNSKCKTSSGEALVENLFGITMDVKLKCAETDAEGESVEEEKQFKLSCHIDGSVPSGDGTNKGGTDLITQSIEKSLEGTLEKMSPTLGRLAVYNKSYRIKRLPKYLLTQFVRFYWKQDTQKKAKILRQVKFPVMLDMKEYCTDEYQQRIMKFREQALKKQEEEKAALKRQKTGGDAKAEEKKEEKEGEGAAAAGEGAAGGAAGGEDAMDVDLSGNEELWANYELTGVLTHQGRSADGGHYVAWIKKANKTWYKFDDDKVTEIKEDDVKKLYGGGDWHMAYICLYQRTDTVIGANSTRY